MNAQRVTPQQCFGWALDSLKAGWNGKGMWLVLVAGSPLIKPTVGTAYNNAGITEPVNIEAHIDMFTAGGSMQPGWLASQADMLAEDWVTVE